MEYWQSKSCFYMQAVNSEKKESLNGKKTKIRKNRLFSKQSNLKLFQIGKSQKKHKPRKLNQATYLVVSCQHLSQNTIQVFQQQHQQMRPLLELPPQPGQK